MPVSLSYNKQNWYEVKITFSNNETNNYLLPTSNKITMTDTILNMHSNIDISRLIGDGLLIEEVKKEPIDSKIELINNKK